MYNVTTILDLIDIQFAQINDDQLLLSENIMFENGGRHDER